MCVNINNCIINNNSRLAKLNQELYKIKKNIKLNNKFKVQWKMANYNQELLN